MNNNMINNKKKKPVIICFAGCDWWFHNRGLFCPQVMTRLAKQYKILFVNSLPTAFPSLANDRHAMKKVWRKFKSFSRYLRKTENGMYIFSPFSLPLFSTDTGRRLNTFFVSLQFKILTTLMRLKKPIFYIGCPPAYEIIRTLKREYLIYERTDLFEEAPGANKSYIAALDYELKKTADMVLYVNTTLWEEGKKINPNSLLIGHGIDYDQFARAEKSDYVPKDIASIPKPIVGYYGAIDDKVCDFKLMEHVAKTMPSISLVLVGPVSSDISCLKKHTNVFFLGHKPYEQIQHYGKVFDVAIMAWKQNKWMEFCNPVITKEYLALGYPIVSIDYPELKPYHDVVYACSNYKQFTDSIRKALDENDPQLKLKRRYKVISETWDNKVKQIEEFINQKMKEETTS